MRFCRSCQDRLPEDQGISSVCRLCQLPAVSLDRKVVSACVQCGLPLRAIRSSRLCSHCLEIRNNARARWFGARIAKATW